MEETMYVFKSKEIKSCTKCPFTHYGKYKHCPLTLCYVEVFDDIRHPICPLMKTGIASYLK